MEVSSFSARTSERGLLVRLTIKPSNTPITHRPRRRCVDGSSFAHRVKTGQMIIDLGRSTFSIPKGCQRLKIMSSLRDLGTGLQNSRILSSLRDCICLLGMQCNCERTYGKLLMYRLLGIEQVIGGGLKSALLPTSATPTISPFVWGVQIRR